MPSSATEQQWALRFGARPLEDKSVEFRVWAPNVTNLAVRILREGEKPRTVPMTGAGDGEFVAKVPDVREGADYFYVLNNERERPDPVSRWLPTQRTWSDSYRKSRFVSLVGSRLDRDPAQGFHHLRISSGYVYD